MLLDKDSFENREIVNWSLNLALIFLQGKGLVPWRTDVYDSVVCTNMQGLLYLL